MGWVIHPAVPRITTWELSRREAKSSGGRDRLVELPTIATTASSRRLTANRSGDEGEWKDVLGNDLTFAHKEWWGDKPGKANNPKTVRRRARYAGRSEASSLPRIADKKSSDESWMAPISQRFQSPRSFRVAGSLSAVEPRGPCSS